MPPKSSSLSMTTSTPISSRASLPLLNQRRRLTNRHNQFQQQENQSRSTSNENEQSGSTSVNPIILSPLNIAKETSLAPQIPIAPPRFNLEGARADHRASSPANLLNIGTAKQHSGDCLKGVVACLDIRTEDGDDVSQNFENALKSMGAKTRKTFADSVTHLIYKNGSATNVRKALHNKNCKIVNLLWITNCKSEGRRLPEEKYLIRQPENLLLTGSRRRKSMEPGKVKALVMEETSSSSSCSSSSAPLDDHIPDKRSYAEDDNSLSKRLKSPANTRSPGNTRSRLSNIHRKKNISHWETSAIISREETISHHGGVGGRPDLLQLGDLDLDFTDVDDSSNLRKHRTDKADSTLPASFSRSMRRLSFKDDQSQYPPQEKLQTIQKPQVNKEIKAGFYIGKQKPTISTSRPSSTSTSTSISTSLSPSLSTASPTCIRRRRQSISNRFTQSPNPSSIPPPDTSKSSPLCSPSTSDLPRSRLPAECKFDDMPTIVMTSMTENSKKQCSVVLRKLGNYQLTSTVDERTTHVIVGCQRRTESVIRALLYGVWLVTPEWILDSGKAKKFIGENEYEAIVFFPRARAARRRDPLLPSNISIYIASTTLASSLIHLCVTKAGGYVVDAINEADIIISSKPMNANAIVVTENWLLDSIENWRYLATNKYSLA